MGLAKHTDHWVRSNGDGEHFAGTPNGLDSLERVVSRFVGYGALAVTLGVLVFAGLYVF
jgi:hypothetical protein